MGLVQAVRDPVSYSGCFRLHQRQRGQFWPGNCSLTAPAPAALGGVGCGGAAQLVTVLITPSASLACRPHTPSLQLIRPFLSLSAPSHTDV